MFGADVSIKDVNVTGLDSISYADIFYLVEGTNNTMGISVILDYLTVEATFLMDITRGGEKLQETIGVSLGVINPYAFTFTLVTNILTNSHYIPSSFLAPNLYDPRLIHVNLLAEQDRA